MKLLSVPETTANKDTPALADSQRGIIFVPSRKIAGGPVQIDGAFRVSLEDATTIGRPLHRSLVCLVWSAAGYQDSVVPFRDTVLFHDDEIQTKDGLWGAYRFQIEMYPGSVFYLHLALGQYLSPSLCTPG